MCVRLGYGNSVVIMSTFIICLVISTGLVSTKEINRIKRIVTEESAGEENHRKFLFDSGYGSRIQTGSQLAKWKALSDYVYGPHGPGRKRSVPLARGGSGNYVIGQRQPFQKTVRDESDVKYKQDLRQRKYEYSLRCIKLLELFWHQYKHNIRMFMDIKDILANVCI